MVVFSRIILIFSVVAMVLITVGCGPRETSGTTVVTSAYPLAFVAERVGGDTVDATNVVPPGTEPHDVELTPRDVEKLGDADLVLYLGGGFQPAVEDAVDGDDDAMDVLEDADSVNGDPHVWLDPLRLAAIGRAVGARLDREAAAGELSRRLEELDAVYASGLRDCAHRVIVTPHASFGYLARRYGLEQVALAGLEPEADPSARELEALADEVTRAGAIAVYAEPNRPRRVVETVARLARVAVHELDPIETVTEGDDYFEVMLRNLDTLRSTLGCR